jgi:hypothetical protein
MKKNRQLVSFDRAIKRLLRNRANFEVVEVFLSELLGRDIKITSVLESERKRTRSKRKRNCRIKTSFKQLINIIFMKWNFVSMNVSVN